MLSVITAPSAAALTSLRLVTLDLDDTLWPTGPVVRSANLALAAAVVGDTEDLQDRLRTARSSTNRPSYSEARVLAIESWLNERDGSARSRRAEAEQWFDLWLAERHAAAGRLLFDGAAEAVAAVRHQHPDALIAAVTNGRGDPLAMPALRPHFDFTISAEDAGIYPERKPAPAPFVAALRRAGVTRPTPALWAHVGDDLINDVQAAKGLGAWTVWLGDDDAHAEVGPVSSSPDDAVAPAPWYSTMSAEECAMRVRAADAARGTADATIREISELPAALGATSRRRGRACPLPGMGSP